MVSATALFRAESPIMPSSTTLQCRLRRQISLNSAAIITSYAYLSTTPMLIAVLLITMALDVAQFRNGESWSSIALKTFLILSIGIGVVLLLAEGIHGVVGSFSMRLRAQG